MSLSDRCLVELRCAAAAAVALPSLRVRVQHAGRTVLAVERPDGRSGGGDHPVLPPCAFHGAVARAHAMRRAGERIGLRGVPDGADPAITWGVPRGDLAMAGSIARVARDDTWIHVASVASPLRACRIAVEAGDGGPPGLGFHADHAVDATLLHLTTPAGDVRSSAEALEALQVAVARASVAELLEHLVVEVPDFLP